MKRGKRQLTRKVPRKGFTLIELLIVIVILLVLAAIAIPVYQNYAEQGRVTAANADGKILSNAIATMQIRHSVLPTDYHGTSLTTASATVEVTGHLALQSPTFSTNNFEAASVIAPTTYEGPWVGVYPTGPSTWPAQPGSAEALGPTASPPGSVHGIWNNYNQATAGNPYWIAVYSYGRANAAQQGLVRSAITAGTPLTDQPTRDNGGYVMFPFRGRK